MVQIHALKGTRAFCQVLIINLNLFKIISLFKRQILQDLSKAEIKILSDIIFCGPHTTLPTLFSQEIFSVLPRMHLCLLHIYVYYYAFE